MDISDKLDKESLVELDFSKTLYEVIFKKYYYILLKDLKSKNYILIDMQKEIAYYNEKQIDNLCDEVEFTSFIQYLNDGRVNLSKGRKCKINIAI